MERIELLAIMAAIVAGRRDERRSAGMICRDAADVARGILYQIECDDPRAQQLEELLECVIQMEHHVEDLADPDGGVSDHNTSETHGIQYDSRCVKCRLETLVNRALGSLNDLARFDASCRTWAGLAKSPRPQAEFVPPARYGDCVYDPASPAFFMTICSTCHLVLSTAVGTKDECDKAATDAGWTVNDGNHYCPTCAKSPRPQAARGGIACRNRS